MFIKGLGKVLFIDEAYRLAEGHFAQEAVDEIVDLVTKPAYKGRMVIILAGYDDDMNRLLRCNAGLSSRFQEEVNFEPLDLQQSMSLLKTSLQNSNISFPALDTPQANEITDLMCLLLQTANWGNARDIGTIAQNMRGEVYQSVQEGPLSLTIEVAKKCIQQMVKTKQNRSTTSRKIIPSTTQLPSPFQTQVAPSDVQTPTLITTKKTAPVAQVFKSAKRFDKSKSSSDAFDVERDAGVSEEVWTQLIRDKQSNIDKEKEDAAKVQAEQAAVVLADQEREQALTKSAMLNARKAQDEKEARELELHRAEVKHRLEQAEMQKRAASIAQEKLLKAMNVAKEKERKVQEKLRTMGICPAGYTWIKQTNGYRCAGGSHLVSDAQLQ